METAEVGISGVYSPGLVCPDGYVTACSATMLSNDPTLTASPSEAFPFLNPIRPGETAVGCCPIFLKQMPNAIPKTVAEVLASGFACVTTTPSPADDWVYQTCISTASQEPLDMIYCGSWQGIATATLNVSATRTKNMALRSSAVLAGMLQLNWQASDRSTSTPLQIKTITTAPAPTATGLLPSSSDDHPARLSTEAKVAIGAVAPVMFLAFIVSLIFMFRRRRRRQLNPSDTPIDYSKPELDGSWPAEWVRRDQQAVELPEENERYELEDNERSHESGPTIYYELPA
ncbi:MAG: hypothetical protein M1820_005348 [Bogoriella megaspora]|nr:MAG: hypothetical protein M1820_005348 [Bogoriella megaspora]